MMNYYTYYLYFYVYTSRYVKCDGQLTLNNSTFFQIEMITVSKIEWDLLINFYNLTLYRDFRLTLYYHVIHYSKKQLFRFKSINIFYSFLLAIFLQRVYTCRFCPYRRVRQSLISSHLVNRLYFFFYATVSFVNNRWIVCKCWKYS